MLNRWKRKLSRTKSVSDAVLPDRTAVGGQDHEFVLSPSDENLITRLATAPEPIPSEPPPAYEPPREDPQSVRTVFNDVNSGMLSLPTEILVGLKKYLRPSMEVALRHTCSRFFYLYSMPSFYLSGEERFDFVCMTERDQDPNELDRLVCGHCRDIHPRRTYPASEVEQPPLDRDCRQVWLCAHKHMGYQKTIRSIKTSVEKPFRTEILHPCIRCREVVRHRSVADRPERWAGEMDADNPKAESLLISKIAIMQRPAPLYNISKKVSSGSGVFKEVFGAAEVSAALQAINFRICPHVRLGDPCILSKFCRACINPQRLPPGVKGPPCISNWNRQDRTQRVGAKCKGSCFDKNCRTKFMFQARESSTPDASGRQKLWLLIVVYRWLGPLLSTGSDTSYRSHTVTHKERVEMRQDWDRWEKNNHDRAVLNWGISLLHPEDCNLRQWDKTIVSD